MTVHLRLANYNIHAGVGSDGRFRPRRLAEVLRRLEADVIGLQEVVSVGPDGCALLDELAEACGMQAIAGSTMLRGDADYGNALLTRLPWHNVRRLELEKTGYEPRGALSLQLGEDDHSLTIAVTHLGLHARERHAQIEQLLQWLPQPPAPVVLLGDLNEWLPWSRNLRRLQQRFGLNAAIPTYPARFPLFALDRILASPAALLHSPGRDNTPLSRCASDHLPLFADLSLPDKKTTEAVGRKR